jgi:hypothetical protein
MAEDYRAKKAAELIEKKRLERVAKNIAEGRTGKISGMPAYDKVIRSATSPQEAMQALRDQGKVTNLEDVIKSTPSDNIGINPEVRNKSKFFNLDKKLAGDVIDDVSDVAKKEGSLLKNTKGFSKMGSMLGLAGAGLAGLSIAGKLQAGELGQAGLETADVATDYVPVLGQLKMAGRPTELGNAELPDEFMKERAVYNAARMGKNREPAVMPSEEMPLLEPEDRTQKKDLDAMLQNILNRKR